MIFKQVPVWSHSISEAAMEKFGSTAAGRAVSSGNSTWRTITGACRDEALHRCGSMWGHSLQQMPLDRARMVRMIQNDSEWLLSAILHLENACGIDKVPSSSKFRIVVILGSAIGIPNPLHICVDMSISTCRDDLSFPFCILFVLFAFCTVFRCIFPIFVRICAFFPREV